MFMASRTAVPQPSEFCLGTGISRPGSQLQKGPKQQPQGVTVREGASFRLQTQDLSVRCSCGLPAPGTTTPQASLRHGLSWQGKVVNTGRILY